MLVWDREGISSFVLVPLEFGAGPTFSSSQCFQDSQQNRNLLRQNTSHLKHPRHIMVSCRSFRSWGHFSKKICCCWCHQSLHHETFHPPTPHLDLRIGHQVLLAKMQQPEPTQQMGGMWGSELGSSSRSLWAQFTASQEFAKHQNSGIWTDREPEFISLPEQPNMG